MKKGFVVFLIAVLIGGGIAYVIFNKVVIKGNNHEEEVVAKAFQIGAFTKYENALRIAERNNGIVVSDKDIFRVYVALLYDDKVIDKLSKYYEDIGLNYYIKDVLVDDDLLDSISSSEELLMNSNTESYSVINLNVLNKYKEFM